MNKYQENKLTMFRAVQQICERNRSMWEGIEGMAKACEEYAAAVDNITKRAENQQQGTEGVTRDKYDAREVLVLGSLGMAGALHALAMERGDNKLMDQVDTTYSELMGMRDEEMVIYSRSLLEMGAALAKDIEIYGVNQEELDSYKAQLEKFAGLVAGSRNAVVERKGATEDLPELIRAADSLLTKKLDKLMERYRGKAPQFYMDYTNARMIVDAGLRHETPAPESSSQV